MAKTPEAVRGLWRETLVSGAMNLLGTIVAYVLVRRSPQWFSSFVSEDYAQGRDPSASYKQLYDTLHGPQHVDGLSVLAAFLFTHNARIALLSFALGFACCLPSAFMMKIWSQPKGGRVVGKIRRLPSGDQYASAFWPPWVSWWISVRRIGCAAARAAAARKEKSILRIGAVYASPDPAADSSPSAPALARS